MIIIDTNIDPELPVGIDGGGIKSHKKVGKIILDFTKISLYVSSKQESGSIDGHQIREELESKNVMNACVLDYLLLNQHLIPEYWRKPEQEILGNLVCFWGTIFHNAFGDLCVRGMVYAGNKWVPMHLWFDDSYFNSHTPAAISENYN